MSTKILHEKAVALASAGDCSNAIVHLESHLQEHPEDGEAWNDAGVILYQAGQTEPAADCLLRALELSDPPETVFGNLVQVCLAAGQWRWVQEALNSLCEQDRISAEWVARRAAHAMQEDQPAAAMEIALQGAALFPEEPQMEFFVERVRQHRPKLAFFCGGDGPTFLRDILAYLERRYQVQCFEGNTVEQVHELMQWSDVSWFEWCTELAEIGSRLPADCRRIVRLHRYEAYENWPQRIEWNHIDTLVTVGNPSVREMLLAQTPDLPQRTQMMTIANAVDLDRIPLLRRRRGKRLAYIGNLRMVKNPMLLLQCFHQLYSRDPEYRLFVAGKVQDAVVAQYWQHMVRILGLESAVSFDGWQQDVIGWLADKQYIVCTSVIEGVSLAILEAMAAGVRPVVHHFPGAAETFGEEYLFATPEEFCRQILEGPYCSQRYRAFVRQRYALSDQLREIDRLIQSLTETEAAAVSSGPGSGSPAAVQIATS